MLKKYQKPVDHLASQISDAQDSERERGAGYNFAYIKQLQECIWIYIDHKKEKDALRAYNTRGVHALTRRSLRQTLV